MKKQRKLIKYIYEEVYRREVLFITGCSFIEAHKELDKFKIKLDTVDLSNADGCVAEFNKESQPKMKSSAPELFLWVENRNAFYVLMHEVVHLTINIFALSNIAIDGATTESFAFYNEFWFKKLWRLMSNKQYGKIN